MNTLAIDTSSKNVIICFNLNYQFFLFVENKTKLGNLTVSLPNVLNDFILKNNIFLKDLDLIINSAGPGSFTGLRISLSFIKGLATGLSLPFVNIYTLDAFVYSLDTNTSVDILALNENINGRYYFAHYRNFKKLDEIKDISEFELFDYIDKNIERGIIVGNETKKVFETFKNKLDIFEDISKFGETLTNLGVKKYLKNKSGDSILSSPFYFKLNCIKN